MLSTLEHDFKFNSSDRFLHHTSICFDLSIVQIFSALTAGAMLCVASSSTRKDTFALGEFIAKSSISITYFTPTQFALLIEACPEELRKCQSYRIAIMCGEILPPRLVRAFHELETSATMYNSWGLSETVVQTTLYKTTLLDCENSTTNVPIGRPMANCRHYVVDSKMKLLPIGLPGEIVVGGAQVGQGYLNRPKVNAHTFVPNPFASLDDLRRGWSTIFKTGDRGRFLSNGELEFLGRIKGDRQVKLQGYRIDLGEVEEQLLVAAKDSQGLLAASVVARLVNKDISSASTNCLTDDRALVAFLTLKSRLGNAETQTFVNVLHAKIKRQLNYYMLPTGYEVLSSIPETLSGKVNYQNLLHRELRLIFPGSDTESVGETVSAHKKPSPITMRKVSAIFRDVLCLGSERHIAGTDNFFELGGQSLLALRLQANIKRVMKVTLPLPSIFEHATPEAISLLIDQHSSSFLPRKDVEGRVLPVTTKAVD